MSRALGLAALALMAALPAPAAAQDAVPGQILVGHRAGVSADRAQALIERAGGQVLRRLRNVRSSVVRVRRQGLALSALRRRLADTDGIAYAEPDYYLDKSVEPNDPLYPSQYAVGPTGAGAIQAPTAWGVRTGCSKVAVLDTGAQYDHPDLAGNIWRNSNEIKANGKDDDKNGYVDDYYGVNLVKGSGSAADDEGHGTHVAGVIAGLGNNGQGISGVCWTATVMPVKFMNSKGKGSTSAAIEAINYAVDEGAKVISCSFGSTSKSSSLQDAVDHAQDEGVLLVIAAGNNGENIDADPEYPAAFTNGNIIAVAANTSDAALASFSNYGPKGVDVAAPGNNILSTYPTNDYKVLSGTSMATPAVSGVAAMLRSRNSKLTYKQIRAAILDHLTPDAQLNGKLSRPGVLNAAAALAAA